MGPFYDMPMQVSFIPLLIRHWLLARARVCVCADAVHVGPLCALRMRFACTCYKISRQLSNEPVSNIISE